MRHESELSRRRRDREGSQPWGADELGSPQPPVSPPLREHLTRLIVDVGNLADSWRDAATDAERAFDWWRTACVGERGTAAAAYVAATDREEAAATEYAKAWRVCCVTAPTRSAT
jgi:hypothetical protein